MASGDDIEAGRTSYAEDRTILVARRKDANKDFVGDFVFEARPWRGGVQPGHRVDGVRGGGQLAGNGVVGTGGDLSGNGVVGNGGEGRQGTVGGHGVVGFGAWGGRGAGAGVLGDSGGDADGAVGICGANGRSGVFGFNSSAAGVAFGVFGRCDAAGGAAVAGHNVNGTAVSGFSDGNIGVEGISGAHIGVYGLGPHLGLQAQGGNAGALAFSPTGHGVVGIAPTRGKFAGAFSGDVLVSGSLTVIGAGAKSAAVRVGKGEYRRLYSMESPESWFEDFGESSLRAGRAAVRLPADFAPLVHTNQYHVFLTPYGECAGLCVASRTRAGFEVRELGGGRSSVRFSYRIVARRKDIPGKRLEKVSVPDLPAPMRLEKEPARARRGDPRRVVGELKVPRVRGRAPRRK